MTAQNVVRGRAASCGRTDGIHPGVSGSVTGSPADEARPWPGTRPGTDGSPARGRARCTLRGSSWDVAGVRSRNHFVWAGRGNQVLCGSQVRWSLDTAAFVCPEAIPRVSRAVFFVSPGQLRWAPCRTDRAWSPAGAALSQEPCRPGRGTRGPRPVAPVVPPSGRRYCSVTRCPAPSRVLW